MYMYIVLSLQLCDKVAMLGTGYKVQGGGRGGAMKIFFKYWFSVAHPRVIWQKLGQPTP